MQGTQISFDGHPLQTANIFVNNIDHESSSTKSAPVYALAHANRSVIPFTSYPSKDITISGQIIADSIPQLDDLLDQFRSWFTGSEKNLDIGYGSGTRRYIATKNADTIKRPFGLLSAEFTITFICTHPFGQNITPTTLLNVAGRTGAAYSDSITFLGSAPLQQPILTITYTAITGGTNATVNFGNNANGQQISVTRTWQTGDVFAVDVINKLVTVNGVSIDFVGAFPEFPPGLQSMACSDSFTARTFNINMIYYPMWL